MFDFLNSLTVADWFFRIGAVSTILFVIKLVLFFISGGLSELSFDFDSISETDTSFNFFTIESILLLFMGFGWVGLTFYSVWKMPLALSVFAGIVFGVLFGCLYAFLLINIKKLDETPKVTEEDYKNAEGKAYTRIFAHSEGQAELLVREQVKVLNVINDTDEEIDAFVPVKVVKVEDNKIFVEKK